MTPDPLPRLGGEALGDAVSRLVRAVQPRSTVDGWATVELDRAEEEVAAACASFGEPRVEPAGDERLLGARCRLLRFGEERSVVLLEPSTEGRLAASLARYGEGNVVLYLLVDAGAPERARRAGFTLTSAGHGPFGAERLVVAGPRFGPFLVLAGFD
jgi:hypothetical protein